MKENKNIVVTGAAGFIASCMVKHLLEAGHHNIIAVDDFDRPSKLANLADESQVRRIPRNSFIAWLEIHHEEVGFIYHLGARTDTAEMDVAIFDALNLNYSKSIWNICTQHQIPLVYASSAATYGDGSLGYDDNHHVVPSLTPLNPYGESKQDFDKWVLEQSHTPPHWVGLKFFNVYGPNEYHKGRMASVIFHAFKQIQATGAMKLFRSHNPQYKDGEQMRDFIYVKDVVTVAYFFFNTTVPSGIYNLGTGKARTFLDLTKATFLAMGKTPSISFVDTPSDIRDKYQYFTQAKMEKLHAAGYAKPFYGLEEGVMDYVTNYLMKDFKTL